MLIDVTEDELSTICACCDLAVIFHSDSPKRDEVLGKIQPSKIIEEAYSKVSLKMTERWLAEVGANTSVGEDGNV